MLLGYNSNGLVHHRLDEALRLLADHGFEAIALTLDVGHLDPKTATSAEIGTIRRLLDQLGLVCVIETGARYVLDPARKHRPNLLETDAAERAIRLEFLERSLEIGHELGARALSFWAGALPEGVDANDARERLRDGIAALLPSSERYGVPLAFEPEPGMLIETVDDALELCDELANPSRLGLTLDVGHLYVTGEGEVDEVLPRIGERLLQVHVEDIRRGIHEHLPPGQGDVDFGRVWRALDDVSYGGPVCWELSRSSHAAHEMLPLVKRVFRIR